MFDGFETRRARTPAHRDWVHIKLGATARVERVLLDMTYFVVSTGKHSSGTQRSSAVAQQSARRHDRGFGRRRPNVACAGAARVRQAVQSQPHDAGRAANDDARGQRSARGVRAVRRLQSRVRRDNHEQARPFGAPMKTTMPPARLLNCSVCTHCVGWHVVKRRSLVSFFQVNVQVFLRQI